MSQQTSLRHLKFPLHTLPAAGETVHVRDLEVLGAGGVRRRQLRNLPNEIVLELHPEWFTGHEKNLFSDVVARTEEWLNPSEVTENPYRLREQELKDLLLEDLRGHFPKTVQFLKTRLNALFELYFESFPWHGFLLTEYFRYFPSFLRRETKDAKLFSIAQYEWLQAYLSFCDFGQPRREPGILAVNPSLQSFFLGAEVEELGLTTGLYVCYFDSRTEDIKQHKLDFFEAAVLDLLQEERKFTLDQLLDQMLLEESKELQITREEWRKKIESLQSQGIL